MCVCALMGCTGDRGGGGNAYGVFRSEGPDEISPAIERNVALIKNDRRVLEAFDLIERLDDRTLEDHIALTEIPAPPFKEERRAEAYRQLLMEAGADSVWIDEEGNVIALRRGRIGARKVALAAHLDTVFPEGTDVTVRQRGDTLFAPGIGDDSRGLVEVLGVLRALERTGIETDEDMLFIGTVGEEGLGDLRGVKHLFSDRGPGIDAWITIDGGKPGNIVYQGLGSHRYRVTFRGPGGHSWGAFGLGNPHHALGEAIHRFVDLADAYTRTGPKTSYSIGRLGGGTSVNSIPFESWMEVDLRSVDPERLQGVDSLLHVAVQEAVLAHNAIRRMGEPVEVDMQMIGNRPSGSLDPNLPLIQRAAAASALMGLVPSYSLASTDSNIPISLSIPSITIGRGGKGGNAHSLNEWWINDRAYLGIQWALLIVLSEAGI